MSQINKRVSEAMLELNMPGKISHIHVWLHPYVAKLPTRIPETLVVLSLGNASSVRRETMFTRLVGSISEGIWRVNS